MIPGGWYRVPDGHIQHWRRHGIGESVCGHMHPHGHGSLLPFSDTVMCKTCLHIFKEAARPHLAHYKAIVARLEQML